MDDQRFIKHIRQYGLLAKRTGKSYGSVVNELVRLRANTIANSSAHSRVAAVQMEEMQDLVKREYQRFDKDFVLTPSD